MSVSRSEIVEELSRLNPEACSSERTSPSFLQLEQYVKVFEGNEEELDPQEDQIDDEDDEDFILDDDFPLPCRAKTKNRQQSRPFARKRGEAKNIGVRGRILRKCGIDPMTS
ncbi:hypothetical protein R1sor_010243 [Riccia sorocarpa]|uniref:Uncharacterized protein n=1 Tax=Riccia sorocarpa TaxID=122646 RepID=A0ABD3HXF6_9MARC